MFQEEGDLPALEIRRTFPGLGGDPPNMPVMSRAFQVDVRTRQALKAQPAFPGDGEYHPDRAGTSCKRFQVMTQTLPIGLSIPCLSLCVSCLFLLVSVSVYAWVCNALRRIKILCTFIWNPIKVES